MFRSFPAPPQDRLRGDQLCLIRTPCQRGHVSRITKRSLPASCHLSPPPAPGTIWPRLLYITCRQVTDPLPDPFRLFRGAAESQLVDEQTLIARAQRGDSQAYEVLVRQYETPAFRAAWLITRDEQEAADAAQEAFVRAFRSLRSFRLGQPFRPWLLQIVTNQALNQVKASERRTRMTERYAEQAAPAQSPPSPERSAAEREQSERLFEAVGKLSPDDQALISLRYFLELSEGEVAQACNIPRGTVKSRLHRTLTRLREIIRREYPDLAELTMPGD